MHRKYIITAVLIVFFIVLGNELFSQCPMCRMAAETNLQNGGTEGKGLNTGILYILSLPYILIGVLGFIWWKNRKQAPEG